MSDSAQYYVVTMPPEAYASRMVIPPTARTGLIRGMTLHPDQGWLVYFNDWPVPVKGRLLEPELIRDVDAVKKQIKSLLGCFAVMPAGIFFVCAFVFSRGFRKKLMANLADISETRLSRHFLLPEYYDPATREIRGAILGFGDDAIIRVFAEAVACILSADRPYRFRLQDIIQELDKQKGIIRQTYHALKFLEKRDTQRNWKGMAFVALCALLLSPTLRKNARMFLSRMDISRFRYDTSDLYFWLKNDDASGSYAVMGMSKAERDALHTYILHEITLQGTAPSRV